MMTTKAMTPNVKRLILARAAQLQLERARAKHGKAGVAEVALTLAENGPSGLREVVQEAAGWTETILSALRHTAGAEAWPDDETMAGEILKRLEARTPVPVMK